MRMHTDCGCNMYEAWPPTHALEALCISGGHRVGLRQPSCGWRSLVLPTNWIPW